MGRAEWVCRVNWRPNVNCRGVPRGGERYRAIGGSQKGKYDDYYYYYYYYYYEDDNDEPQQ